MHTDGKIGGREFLQLPTDTEVLRELHVSPGFKAYLRARVNQVCLIINNTME